MLRRGDGRGLGATAVSRMPTSTNNGMGRTGRIPTSVNSYDSRSYY